jgi:hypothetical protein
MSRYDDMLMRGNENNIYELIVVLNSGLGSVNVRFRLLTLDLVV